MINTIQRIRNAFRIRVRAARRQRDAAFFGHPTNGDEARYRNKIASYSKGLPHNALGEVTPSAYRAMLNALTSGVPANFEAIPLGGPLTGAVKLTNPQAGLGFGMALSFVFLERQARLGTDTRTGGEAMRNEGSKVGWWPRVRRAVALLALVTLPATPRAEQKASGGEDLRERVEGLEKQLGERSHGARLGGHFGFVFPLVTSDGSDTVTIDDDFVIGFPMGITVKKEGPWAFDLELVPSINDHDVELTVHPGVLYAIDENWTAGLRMGFDIQQSSWGFTPLINRRLYDLTESSHLFIELPVPIRIEEDNSVNVTVALHLGIGF